MPTHTDLKELRVAVTGGTSGLGLALVRQLVAPRRARRLCRPYRRGRSSRSPMRRAPAASSATSGARTTSTRSRCKSPAISAGLDALINNASSLGPTPLAPLADTECEELEQALAVNLLGPFRLTKASARRPCRFRAERARRGRDQHFERRGGQSLSGLGRLRRKQGGASPPDGDLGRGGEGRRRPFPFDRSWRHGHAAARAGRSRCRSDDVEAARGRRRGDRRRALGALPNASRPSRRGTPMIAADGSDGDPPSCSSSTAMAAYATCRAPHWRRLFSPGDLVIANDAATLPASLHGMHCPSGEPIEVRLAAWVSSRRSDAVRRHRVRRRRSSHAHRRPCRRRRLSPGDRLALGPLDATVDRLLDHPRLFRLRFVGDRATIFAGLARHGRPIQYAHVPEPLALWDVWTSIAAEPIAFEPPSAGFALDWRTLSSLAAARRRFCHAHACRRSLLDRRPGARPAAPFRRALSHPSTTPQRRSIARNRTAGASSPSGRPSSGRWNRRQMPTAACAPATALRADASGANAASRRGRDPHRRARTGRKPLRTPARLRRRRGAGPDIRGRCKTSIPRSRVRRLGADRTSASRIASLSRMRERTGAPEGISEAVCAPNAL